MATAALEAGAVLINDIGGLDQEGEMARVAAEFDVALVILHLRGKPKQRNDHCRYDQPVIAQMSAMFEDRVTLALKRGLAPEQIALDPGIDFAKRPRHSLSVLKRMGELTSRFPFPWLAAVSRKTVIGAVLDGQAPADRDPGTAACVSAAIQGGCHIVRVHNVKAMQDVCRTIDAILLADPPETPDS